MNGTIVAIALELRNATRLRWTHAARNMNGGGLGHTAATVTNRQRLASRVTRQHELRLRVPITPYVGPCYLLHVHADPLRPFGSPSFFLASRAQRANRHTMVSQVMVRNSKSHGPVCAAAVYPYNPTARYDSSAGSYTKYYLPWCLLCSLVLSGLLFC
jgi:hypothetical protein